MKLFSRLFGSRSAKSETLDIGRPKPATPVFVVGDIHGRDDLLQELLEKVQNHAVWNDSATLVTVGDYIDRGEQSSAVLKRLRGLPDTLGTAVISLMGNHEKMMLDFIDRPEERGARWLRNGGLQTLASFGIGGVTETSTEDKLQRAAKALNEAMGDGLLDWVRDLPLSWHSGNLWVVHAAADPTLPMSVQSDRTFLWGNGPFLQNPRDDGLWIAHGHTVTDVPQDAQSRIATDTGAYHTGRLTCAVIPPSGEVDWLQT